MDAAALSLHGVLPDEPSFSSVLISLVVLRNAEGKFASTHERDGWYLPAGRVDAGEGFATGAVREALEEAGVPVNLTGILRIEHTPGMRSSRLRVIYTAEPADDTPLKSVPDHETIEAQWLTVEELKKKRRIRAHEVVSLFEWAQSGTRVFPTSLLESEDCAKVDHMKVQVQLVAAVEAVVVDENGRYLAMKKETRKWGLPSATLTRPRQFKLAAAELINGIMLQPEGVLKVYYFAPGSPRNPNPTGFIKVVFLATIAEKDRNEFDPSAHNGQWLTAQEWDELLRSRGAELENENAAHLVALAHNTPRDQVAPVEVIAMEVEELQVL